MYTDTILASPISRWRRSRRMPRLPCMTFTREPRASNPWNRSGLQQNVSGDSRAGSGPEHHSLAVVKHMGMSCSCELGHIGVSRWWCAACMHTAGHRNRSDKVHVEDSGFRGYPRRDLESTCPLSLRLGEGPCAKAHGRTTNPGKTVGPKTRLPLRGKHDI